MLHQIETFFVRVARIELASQPWEGRILPLNHTRAFLSITQNVFLQFISPVKFFGLSPTLADSILGS